LQVLYAKQFLNELGILLMFKIVEIPEIFYSTESGKPFEICMDCERNLVEADLDYVIEKAVKRYPDYNTTDTILEYAICLHCHQKVRESFSEESINRVEAYFTQNMDIFSRMTLLGENPDMNINNWISECMVKGTPVEKLREYQIFGHFKGDKIVLSYLPGLLSIDSLEELTEILSQKTKDELGGYMKRFSGIPPEFEEIFRSRPVFVL